MRTDGHFDNDLFEAMDFVSEELLGEVEVRYTTACPRCHVWTVSWVEDIPDGYCTDRHHAGNKVREHMHTCPDILTLFDVDYTVHIEPETEDDFRRTMVNSIHLCPGCQAWTIEHSMWEFSLQVSYEVEPAYADAARAAQDHRRDCEALDMLAGLIGA